MGDGIKYVYMYHFSGKIANKMIFLSGGRKGGEGGGGKE